MKKGFTTLFLLLFIAFNISAFAQEETKEKTDEIKTGWNLGALPVISFDSDMGFQYGALSSIYH